MLHLYRRFCKMCWINNCCVVEGVGGWRGLKYVHHYIYTIVCCIVYGTVLSCIVVWCGRVCWSCCHNTSTPRSMVMCCITMYRGVSYYNVWRCIPVYCDVSQCIVMCCNVLWCVVSQCSVVLRYIVMCCVTMYCDVLYHNVVLYYSVLWCVVWQCIVMCCITMYCDVLYYNAMWCIVAERCGVGGGADHAATTCQHHTAQCHSAQHHGVCWLDWVSVCVCGGGGGGGGPRGS